MSHCVHLTSLAGSLAALKVDSVFVLACVAFSGVSLENFLENIVDFFVAFVNVSSLPPTASSTNTLSSCQSGFSSSSAGGGEVDFRFGFNLSMVFWGVEGILCFCCCCSSSSSPFFIDCFHVFIWFCLGASASSPSSFALVSSFSSCLGDLCPHCGLRSSSFHWIHFAS